MFDCEASFADGRLWIATGPFVFERTAAGFTTHVAAATIAETKADNPGPSVAAIALPPLLGVGLGMAGGAAIDDDHRFGAVALETLAGTVAGLPVARFLEFLDDNPCIEGNDSGYQIYNDFACRIRGAGYVLGVAGGGALGAAGTYAVGREFDDLPAKRDAYLGAWVGGSAGGALSILSTKLMRRYLPDAGPWTRTFVAATLIGTGSTIGYQLAR
jgi:hypothetical protein